MGMGSTIKAIWQLLQGTTNPDVVALYNNLYQKLEGAKMGSSSKNFARNNKGSVFFVNGGADGVTTGNNANNGLTPATAFLTITYAHAQCTNDNDDYIYCFNVYNQEPAFPVVIALDSVHIIGIAGPDGSWPALVPPGDTAVFDLTGPAYENCEIAGFNLGGGATHAAIEIGSGCNMTWIHNNTFGHFWHGGTCQDGIRVVGGSTFNLIIEDNWFYGSNGPTGKLTRYGIEFAGAASIGQSTIRDNIFIELTCAMHLHGNAIHEVGVFDNRIGCGVDALGCGIDLGGNAVGCTVMGNEAHYGSAAIMTNNPYTDAAANTANHWASNQVGSVIKYADEAL